jgi:hypothetical protein
LCLDRESALDWCILKQNRFLNWCWVRSWSRSKRCKRMGCPWMPSALARRPATSAAPPSIRGSATRYLGLISLCSTFFFSFAWSRSVG